MSKKLLATSLIILSTGLMFSPISWAQLTDESAMEETTEQLEVIDENEVAQECILSSELDAMNEDERNASQLPECDDVEVTTEQLADEVYVDNTLSEETIDSSQCILPTDYDAMTEEERASIEEPLCEELSTDDSADLQKS